MFKNKTEKIINKFQSGENFHLKLEFRLFLDFHTQIGRFFIFHNSAQFEFLSNGIF